MAKAVPKRSINIYIETILLLAGNFYV